MTLYLLKKLCPKCGSQALYRSAAIAGQDIPDAPDVPWVTPASGFMAKRFDVCMNHHNFNIRPYGDYDDHYIYEHSLDDTITGTNARLCDLYELKAQQAQSQTQSLPSTPKPERYPYCMRSIMQTHQCIDCAIAHLCDDPNAEMEGKAIRIKELEGRQVRR